MKFTINALRSLVAVLTIVIIFSVCSMPTGEAVITLESVEFNSKATLLMDYDSGELIYSRNENEKLFPASTTKIMTLLLAFESLERGDISLHDEVPITYNAAGMGGSQLFLSQGDVVDMESLLIGIAVGSGNDASVAVAEYISGSESAFVNLMNERALELNMNNTKFINPTGLHHDEHYSTAYDIALMGCELLNHELFFRWSTIWMDENFLEGQIRSGKVFLSNTNRMVRFYRGCDGIKTGYTREAGHNIAATAKRNGTRFIAVVLGAPDSDTRYAEATTLLDYAFANFVSVSLKDDKEIIASLPVEKGNITEVNIVATQKVSFLLKKGEEANYKTDVVLPPSLKSPLVAGEVVGTFTVFHGDRIVKTVGLEVAQDVENATFHLLFRRYLDSWLNFGRKKIN